MDTKAPEVRSTIGRRWGTLSPPHLCFKSSTGLVGTRLFRNAWGPSSPTKIDKPKVPNL